MNTNGTLTAKDLATDQDNRWCSGCGDYSLWKQIEPNWNIQSIAQLEKDNKILASFKENKSYLSKSYIQLFVVGLVFLVTGLIFLSKTINK